MRPVEYATTGYFPDTEKLPRAMFPVLWIEDVCTLKVTRHKLLKPCREDQIQSVVYIESNFSDYFGYLYLYSTSYVVSLYSVLSLYLPFINSAP